MNARLTVGAGLFVQGGSGVSYRNLNTAFGTRDDISAQFGAVKLLAGGAWAFDEDTALGFSLALVHARLEQRFFPQTSFVDADRSFHGFELSGADALDYSVKLGVRRRLGPDLTIAAAYTVRTPLDFENGALTMNFGATGLGKVRYSNVSMRGLALPREFGLGLSWYASNRLLLAGDLTWLDWSDAFDRTTLLATGPDSDAAPDEVLISGVHEWRDQIVFALGAAYEADADTVFRFGYNYGRSPIPEERLNPLVAPTYEHHFTAGFGRRISNAWRLDAGLEYSPKKKVTYTNTDLPFGANAQSINEALALHLSVTRQW